MIADPKAFDTISAQEAARLLQVSRPYLYRLIGRGVLDPVDNKNPLQTHRPRLLFRREDVERLAQPIQRAG